MENPIFYDSKSGKYFTPEENGWYIQYSKESGEIGIMKVDRKPKNMDDALKMLMLIDSEELWDVMFFAEII
jgi:hypothetical protein